MRNNVGLLLAKRAALSPRLEALVEVERGRRFTFAELNARANRDGERAPRPRRAARATASRCC